MKSFQFYCDAVGYDKNATAPTKKVIFFAYSKGEVKQFDSAAKAREFSDLVDFRVINQSDIEQFDFEQKQKYERAVSLWEADLYQRYSNVPAKVLRVCFSAAHGHLMSSSEDGIVDALDELVDFAKQVIVAAGCQ